MAGYATTAEVEARAGETFNPAETDQAAAILDEVAESIAAVCDQVLGWRADPVPPAFKVVSIEVTIRAMANPSGSTTSGESLGSYSYTENFAESSSGPELTRREVLSVRRGLFGSNAAAPRVRGLVDDVIEETYGAEAK